MSSPKRPIELLAPARDCEAVVAAVDYGADAVYIGGARFGARHAAANDAAQIARAVEYARRYGVRVYATLNTLLRDDELEEAERQARELIGAGVDALIVQDMALRRMNLPVELHASTQVHTLTPGHAQFLERCGFARVILERAMSLDEIRAVCAATSAEVECFVHGAICVGYSGRCFLSRSMGPRSGNRGECAQPCRLAWDLTDGRGRTYLAGKHLLSLRDMNLSARLGELMDAGVSSFKIEGRLKEIGYIRNVVAWYRRAMDEALASRPELCRASVGRSVPDFAPDPSKSFTRGESEYYFDGRRAGVASLDTPKAVGEYVGRVASVGARDFVLDRAADLAPGDGICFGGAGTNVNAAEGRRVVPNRMEGVVPGAEVYRNYDHRFSQQVARSRTRRTIGVRAEFAVEAGRAAVRYVDCEGLAAEASCGGDFAPARDAAKMEATLREQLSRSGDTIFRVEEVAGTGAERFVPVSVLAALRREGLERLAALRASRVPEHRILPEDPAARYPGVRLTEADNVTNRLAEAFYRDHGVTEIEPPLELARETTGRCVMRTAYCLRRELGECLKRNPRLAGELWLERDRFRYRLEFDCARCEMCLIDEKESICRSC